MYACVHEPSILNNDSIDLWSSDNRTVAVAPNFDEDLTFPITTSLHNIMDACVLCWARNRPSVLPNSTVITEEVSFTIWFGAICLDEAEAGSEVFLCIVTQSPSEFIYHMKRVCGYLTTPT